MNRNQPIGIFDSGVGGLTVAHAIKKLMPNEDLIYFGDTAHLPYGDKSAASIQKYADKITQFLIDKGAKTVVIACNTASAHAYEYLEEKYGSQIKIFNVIDPAVNTIFKAKELKKVGIIGTKGTIQSNTYQKKISKHSPAIDVISLATPLFAPMIEEGFIFDDISNALIRAYLNDDRLSGIDHLLLGCTHYPIIKNQIRKFFNFQVKIIDSTESVASEVKDFLSENDLLTSNNTPNYEFFVSDYTEVFERIGEMFFEEKLILKLKNIW